MDSKSEGFPLWLRSSTVSKIGVEEEQYDKNTLHTTLCEAPTATTPPRLINRDNTKRATVHHPHTTVVNITPPSGRFSNPDCSTIKRVPIPNDTSSESSPRDVSNADHFFGPDIVPTVPAVEMSTMDNRPGGARDGVMVYTVVYGDV